jgi:Ca2+-binding EF-hand superfamily protein
LMIPEVVMNPLAQRLMQLFDRDGEDRINFRSFVMGLSVFNEKATHEMRSASESPGLCHPRLASALAHSMLNPSRRSSPLPPILLADLFRVFDCDADGFITGDDLRKMLQMMAGKSLSPSGVDAVIERTLLETDMDRDGRISLADFRASMDTYPWDTFTVPVKKTSREEYFLQLAEASQARSGAPNMGMDA